MKQAIIKDINNVNNAKDAKKSLQSKRNSHSRDSDISYAYKLKISLCSQIVKDFIIFKIATIDR